MSGLDVEREASEEQGQTRGGRGATLSVREEKVDHTRHKETPTTRDSPFYCTQHLFIYSPFYISSCCLFKSINCYWGTLHCLQNKKKEDFCRFPTPSTRFRKGRERGKKAGLHPLGRKAVLPQPNVLQDIYSLGFSQGQAEVTGTKEFHLANKRFLSY